MEKIDRVLFINLLMIAIGLIVITITISVILTLRKKDVIIKFFRDIRDSLYLKEGGFVTRKLGFWFGLMTGATITIKHATPLNSDTFLQTWLLFSAACIGMVTYGEVQKKKIDKGDLPTDLPQ